MTDALTPDEARGHVAAVLARIAPEVDLDEVDGSEPLQEELDLDSMDVLHLVGGIHERTGIEVPERELGQVDTLDALVAYLVDHAR